MVNNIDLKQGDVFCSENTAFFSKMINIMQKINSKDNCSVYSHAGIITSFDGATFEALSTIRADHLKRRKGQKVLIARPIAKSITGGAITALDKKLAITEIVSQYNGKRYPWWRIILHAIPFAAKYVSAHGRFLVCSELVAKYLYLINARHHHYTGTDPDDLADEWIRWKNFEIIFEGVL